MTAKDTRSCRFTHPPMSSEPSVRRRPVSYICMTTCGRKSDVRTRIPTQCNRTTSARRRPNERRTSERSDRTIAPSLRPKSHNTNQTRAPNQPQRAATRTTSFFHLAAIRIQLRQCSVVFVASSVASSLWMAAHHSHAREGYVDLLIFPLCVLVPGQTGLRSLAGGWRLRRRRWQTFAFGKHNR